MNKRLDEAGRLCLSGRAGEIIQHYAAEGCDVIRRHDASGRCGPAWDVFVDGNLYACIVSDADMSAYSWTVL